MTQPAPQLHVPGLITAAGGVQQPLPTAAQPGSVPGQLPAAQPPAPAPAAPAPAAPDTATVSAVPGGVATVEPGTPAVVQPVLPTMVPGYVPTTTTTTQPAFYQPPFYQPVPGLTAPAVPGLNPPATPAAPAPAPTAPAQPAPSTPEPPATGAEDRGYPQGTPLEQMTGDQREAYWKHHARQWEDRAKARNDYDALKAKAEQLDQMQAANATETEKAIAAARQEGYQQAAARAAIVLVDAHVRAGLQTRLAPDQVEALAANLNHTHFLAADGMTVDAAKVSQFVGTVAPAPAAQVPAATAPPAPTVPGALPTGVPAPVPPAAPVTGLPRALPDLGQGAGNTAPIDKLEAGRAQARAFLSGQR